MPNELKSTELIITAHNPPGEPYQFRVHEFENGLIVDEFGNEIFFSEREQIETSCEHIISIEDTGKSKTWTLQEIINLAGCSVRCFGMESLPQKLFTLLEEG